MNIDAKYQVETRDIQYLAHKLWHEAPHGFVDPTISTVEYHAQCPNKLGLGYIDHMHTSQHLLVTNHSLEHDPTVIFSSYSHLGSSLLIE